MLIDDVIARIDVDDPSVLTAEGAHVGSTEAEIMSLYGSNLTVAPHKYEANWHYLTVADSNPARRGLRYVFETDGQTVKSYRAGRLPEVEFVERCG
jgi:hypothetical protein